MPLKKDNLERQLEAARNALSGRAQVLESRGVAENDFRKDPAWRQLRSRRARIFNRLRAAEAVVAIGEKTAE